MIYPVVFRGLIQWVLEEELNVQLQKKRKNKATCRENNFSDKAGGREPTS